MELDVNPGETDASVPDNIADKLEKDVSFEFSGG